MKREKKCRGNQKREANTNRQRSKKSNLRSDRTTPLDNDRLRGSSIKGCLDDATEKKKLHVCSQRTVKSSVSKWVAGK